MNIKEIDKIAKLANLYLNHKEKEVLLSDLNKIVSYVEKINQLDTDSISPDFKNDENSIFNVYREDVIKQTPNTNFVKELAPDSKDGFIKVPKVL